MILSNWMKRPTSLDGVQQQFSLGRSGTRHPVGAPHFLVAGRMATLTLILTLMLILGTAFLAAVLASRYAALNSDERSLGNSAVAWWAC